MDSDPRCRSKPEFGVADDDGVEKDDRAESVARWLGLDVVTTDFDLASLTTVFLMLRRCSRNVSEH